MMDQNQSNEDALQKAIDDITKNALNETAPTADASDIAMTPDLTMPEMPVAGPITDIPAAPEAPVMPEAPVAAEPAAEEAPATPEMPAEPAVATDVAAEPVAEEQPAVPTENQNTGSNSIKERALRDLAPILSRVELEPEKKFQIYIEIINTLGDQSVYEDAYNTATEISDEKSRGEALFKLIEILDK